MCFQALTTVIIYLFHEFLTTVVEGRHSDISRSHDTSMFYTLNHLETTCIVAPLVLRHFFTVREKTKMNALQLVYWKNPDSCTTILVLPDQSYAIDQGSETSLLQTVHGNCLHLEHSKRPHTLDTTAPPQVLHTLSMVANSEPPHLLPQPLPRPLAPTTTTDPKQQPSARSLQTKTITKIATRHRTYLPQQNLQLDFPRHAR